MSIDLLVFGPHPDDIEIGLGGSIARHTAEGRSVIIVTHKLHEIIEVADRITIMRDGRTVATLDKKATTEAELARMMVGRDVALKVRRTPLRQGNPILRVPALMVRASTGPAAPRPH